VKDAHAEGYGTDWKCVKLVFPWWIHCVKIMRITFSDTPPNPFVSVQTFLLNIGNARSGAPIGNRIAWYFMPCEAVAAIRDRLPAELYLDNHHEDLVLSVEQTLERLCGFLGLPAVPEHAQAVKEMVFATPKQTRASALWQPKEVQLVLDGIARFDFLSRYAMEDISLLKTASSAPTAWMEQKEKV